MSSKQKFIQGWWDVNLVHENEKPKTWEEYKNRLEDPNLKDEIALTMSWDKKGLKKRFKKGEYQRWLVDNLKYGSDKSKDFTIDDFVRLAEVQQWTLKEYAIWLKEYIEKNKYISPDNLPALFELVDKYRTKYRSNELDDLFDDNISQILWKMFKFLDKNKWYEPNQEAMLRFKKIIMNANQEDATIHLRQGEKHLSYNLFLKCVWHIKDIDKRKEVLSNMKDFFKNAIWEHIFFAWGIDVPTDCSRYPNGWRDYPPTEYIKIESWNQEIKWNLYIYVWWVGYMDTVNWNILEVEIDGKMEPITYFNGRQGIIKVWDKELINAETKKHSFVFDTDTMQSYRDIKINGKELAYISPSYSLWNKSVLYVYPRRGPSFVIDAETFEPLKIKWTEKYIHSIDDRTLFLNKKCAIANWPQNLRPRSSVLIDEETLEPIKITGTDDIITCVETISDSEEKIGTRLLYRVKTKKQKKWKEWIVVDGETWEPLKISGTDDVITYVRQLNDNQKIGGRLLYFVKTNKWEQGIIVNWETLEPLKIKWIENIIKSVYTKEKYSLWGKECYLVKDGKNNNLRV